jgi:outer membrane lipoprotein SlyB
MHPLLLEGLSDAVGFIGGALLGYWLGQALGVDPLAPGYGPAALGGIALVGLGGGVGLHLARRWRNLRRNAKDKDAA